MTWSRIENCTPGSGLEQKEGKRIITWAQAIREALDWALGNDEDVFVMGQGVDDPGSMFGATKNLHSHYPGRVFDTPLCEGALTGIATGCAQLGMRPVYMHNRPDFLYLALDQLANHAAKMSFMFAGQISVPLVIWACIGRGWGGGAQHSQAPQATFAHIPGLKVVMPASCEDAKGLMLAAIADNNPVVIIDHRFNFRLKGHVPEEPYKTPLGKAKIVREGKDATVVAFSQLVNEALKAAQKLSEEGIEIEVIDPRTITPLDKDAILASLAKTGRLIVADTGSFSYGITAEIAALAAGPGFHLLKAPVERVATQDCGVPAAPHLEEQFFVGEKNILLAVKTLLKQSS